MSNFSARAETELKLDDEWMEAHYNDEKAEVDCFNRTPIEAFAPNCRTAPCNGANGRFAPRMFRLGAGREQGGGVDMTATAAVINKAPLNHQSGRSFVDRYTCAVLHHEGLRYIYPYRTTARDISIYC
jgi:hypothetical protein